MVKHILKNGKEVKDIKGHIVRKEELKALYLLIDKMKGEKK